MDVLNGAQIEEKSFFPQLKSGSIFYVPSPHNFLMQIYRQFPLLEDRQISAIHLTYIGSQEDLFFFGASFFCENRGKPICVSPKESLKLVSNSVENLLMSQNILRFSPRQLEDLCDIIPVSLVNSNAPTLNRYYVENLPTKGQPGYEQRCQSVQEAFSICNIPDCYFDNSQP